MRLHERESIVREAKGALLRKTLEWVNEWEEELTLFEDLFVFEKTLGDYLSQLAQSKIRGDCSGTKDTLAEHFQLTQTEKAPQMKTHEREEVVHQAEIALREKILEWMKEHRTKLTFAEELRVVGGELGDYLSRMAKYEIRRERHGDENKPGGLA